MTERLYYRDCYLASFRARVMDVGAEGKVYLDRTAFYPASGGQPFDLGTIGASAVTEVIDENDRIAHIVAGDPPSGEVECRIDFARRFDHMQQHTGQHLLSAVLVETCGVHTVSFHLGRDSSTIEVAAASLTPEQIAAAERRTGEIVFENRPVTIGFEHAAEAAGLRKPAEREGELRIVEIAGLDRSACGGTHVRATAEIGPVLIRKLEKIRGNLRIEFLCGARAVARARADYDALNRVARIFSASLDEVPALVAAQNARLADAEKAARKLATELAQFRGRELYGQAAPATDGVRRIERRPAALDESVRAEAQSFTAGSKAVFLAHSESPPALLLAASRDSGCDAGALFKSVAVPAGGRGGGNAQLAQGSVPSADILAAVLAGLRAAAGF